MHIFSRAGSIARSRRSVDRQVQQILVLAGTQTQSALSRRRFLTYSTLQKCSQGTSFPSDVATPRQVEAGADLGACSKDGLTALDVAASRNYLLLECYLKTEGAFSSAEFWSAADSGKNKLKMACARCNEGGQWAYGQALQTIFFILSSGVVGR